MINTFWLVVSTPLKNISQLGLFFPMYGKNVPNHQPALNHHIKPAFTSRFTPQWPRSSRFPKWGNPVVSRCFRRWRRGFKVLAPPPWLKSLILGTHTHIYIYILYVYIYIHTHLYIYICVCDGNTIGSMQWDWHNGTYWLTTVTSTGLVHNSPQWIQQGIQHVSIYNWRYNPLRHRMELKKTKATSAQAHSFWS